MKYNEKQSKTKQNFTLPIKSKISALHDQNLSQISYKHKEIKLGHIAMYVATSKNYKELLLSHLPISRHLSFEIRPSFLVC